MRLTAPPLAGSSNGLTVVIPLRNRGGARLWNCLNALNRQTVPPVEVIVSDLSSSEEHLDDIRSITTAAGFTFLCTVWTSPKFSRSVAANCGIRAARSRYVLVVDVDAVLAPNTIEEVMSRLAPDTMVLCEHRRGRAPEPGEDLSSDWDAYYVSASENPWPHIAAGMLMGAERTFWMAMGGFDERFTGWGAEDDYVVWKARQRGQVVWIDAPRIVHQDHPDIPGKDADRGANASLFSKLTMERKRPSRSWGTRPVRELTRQAEVLDVVSPPVEQASYDVLFLLPSFPPYTQAGAEYAALGLAKEMESWGWGVAVVVSQGDGQRHDQDGIAVYTGAAAWTPQNVSDLIASFSPSICVSQYDSTYAVTRARLSGGFRHVVYCHTSHSYDGYDKEDADCWLFTSRTLWEGSGRFGGDRAMLLRPLLLTGRMTASTARRRRKGWVRDSVTMLNPSVPKGGLTFLHLARRFPDQHFLVTANTYGDAVDCGTLPNVEVVDVGGDLVRFYSRSLVHLVPSHYESYGMAATEAALAGSCVLATEMPALREALFDKGTYIPAEDLDLWCRVLGESLVSPTPTNIAELYVARRARDVRRFRRSVSLGSA